MTQSPSVVAAAASLAEWARERRRTWSDEPLPVPAPLLMSAAEDDEDIEEVEIEEELAEELEEISEPAAPMLAEEVEEAVPEPEIIAIEEPVVRGPSPFETIAGGLKLIALNAVDALSAALERLEPLGEPAMAWLVRGAAIVSTLSVLLVVGLNSGRLFSRWDRVAAMVIAATNRPPSQPPPIAPPSGTGRLSVESLDGAAQVLVDGTPRGIAPITIDVPAGAHRVLLRSEKGSVERAVRIQAGEPSEIKEAIFPGWIALTTPVDLSLSEDGRPLRKDERGWAILPPGPHEIHLDNRALGVHEVRRVVVMPGDTTRLSFSPQASTFSLTTNEPADVWIDGTSFGQSPLVDQPITLGMHDVRLRSAAHERWLRVRATVQPVTVNVDLTAN